MRSAIAACALTLLGGCPTEQQPTCDVEAQVKADVFQRDPVTRCEALLQVPDGGSEAAGWAAAQACVLEAVGPDRRSFTFVYDTPGGRSGLSGYRALNGRMVVRQYALTVDAKDPGHPLLSVRSCNESGQTPAVLAASGCTPMPGAPCLSCSDPSPGTILCGR